MDAGFAVLLVLVAVGSWFQTLTGFGLGMIVVGAASALGLAPLAALATLVNLVSLPQYALALRGCSAHIAWRLAVPAVIGMLPSIALGVALLDRLDERAALVLQALLGAVIVYSAFGLARRPQPLPAPSAPRSFLASGLAGGLMSGLFGMPGPPLIFHFYRQPLALPQIRSMLLAVFTAMSLWRTLASALQGQFDAALGLQAAVALPVMGGATLLARRFPPPLSPVAMRRLAYGVLTAIGIALAVQALWGLAAVQR
ncbi:sulfite exporter TauE/SafE family protein [Azohydromonas aeria]|uniref:sulfite exporter TauE/SafE family protein n=1 Tax=Azohydromonas aeria TaxID=2590212 RepID=UPI0012F8973F|nr:sulfite exporter TauE/SafE family protein [Azohydromonas aeria]